jgi:[ribosomal protein S5]-alanine N-acetyltransferase
LGKLLVVSSAEVFPTLETDRLILREITPGDAPELFAIHGDAEAMKWFGNDPLDSIDGALKLIEVFAEWRRMPNPGTRFGIELNDEPGLIGTCGLFRWNRSWQVCSIGYELAAAQQGKGYLNEAATAIVAWGFDAMQLNRVEAAIHPENAPSIALVKKIGFVEEGRAREAGFWGGKFHDLLQFSLLKSDWQDRHITA